MPDWINPKYAAQLAEIGPIIVMGNCNNCHGTGRHIYVDTDGKMKDLPCMACGGSGQTPDQ